MSERSKNESFPEERFPEKFESKELKQSFDGWDLFKKNKISLLPVRKYISHVDADYKRNKVTVCANLSNIYNTFIVRNGRPGNNVNNFFDIEKWLNKFGNECEEEKHMAERDLKRINTQANFSNDPTSSMNMAVKDSNL